MNNEEPKKGRKLVIPDFLKVVGIVVVIFLLAVIAINSENPWPTRLLQLIVVVAVIYTMVGTLRQNR
ncbi:MAG: hypothetical protein FWE76_05095 [Symbiobacteriaceae bacterium]|nr:hypothetical protein [Symbiobacteriaceae bacterium]